jgi:high-affinity iron transporter
MLGSALIVFREVLEAALIIAVVMGASRGAAGRGRWVSGGIAAGLIGAAVVAAFAGSIADAVEGRGQELFNAGVLILAVVMLMWHNVWVSAHGRALAARLRDLGADVRVGAKPLSALALVTMLAVLREGSESVLFLYGLAASGADAMALLAGGGLGLAGGGALGWLLYRGLVAVPVGHFFTVVTALISLLAAGLAANAAGFLSQAALLPPLGFAVWDTSHIVDQQGWLGSLLHILVGYNDKPMGIQVLFYVATLVLIVGLGRLARRENRDEAALAEAQR